MKKWLVLLGVIMACGISRGAVHAATSTVCGSGCDFTTLSSAVLGVSSGDVVAVGATYDPTSEVYPLSPPVSVTIDCQSSGATIGSVAGDASLFFVATSTIRNCSLSGIRISQAGYHPDAIQILNNTFSRVATTTISFPYGASNFLIEGNRDINAFSIDMAATGTSGIIRNNTFYTPASFLTGEAIVSRADEVASLVVASNTISIATEAEGAAVSFKADNVEFVTNTVRYVDGAAPPSRTSVSFSATTTLVATGNMIETANDVSCIGLAITAPQGGSPSWFISHNTFILGDACEDGVGLAMDDLVGSTASVIASIYNNLFYHPGNASTSQAIDVQVRAGGANLNMDANDYNAAYNFSEFLAVKNPDAGTFTLGAHSYTQDPFLQVKNVSTADDFQLAHFSPYLDIVGTADIGAFSAARTGTIVINSLGTIDYSSVDATTTANIADVIRTGDTINIHTGTYAPITINSALATSSITITGIGANVILDGALTSGTTDALNLTAVTSSAISNITVRGATESAVNYTADLANMRFGGITYDEAAPPIGNAVSSTVIMHGVCEGDSFASYTANGYDINSIVGAATSNWHLLLASISMGGPTYHTTILIPNNVYTSAAEVEAACGGAIVADAFVADIFTVSGGVFTYHAPDVSTGITLAPWLGTTPALNTIDLGYYAGLRLSNSNNVTVTGVTSTANGNGIVMDAGSHGNTISDSTLSSNAVYDLLQESGQRNLFDNVSFLRTSTTFSGAGDLLVSFDARVQLLAYADSAAISGGFATSTDAAASVTDLGLTDGSGYTSYASLPAYVMNSATSSETSGGYNPYVFAASLTGYNSTSTSVTLNEVNKTVTLTAISTSVPTAPSSATATAIGTTTTTVAWTDNALEEQSFNVQYWSTSAGESVPGTSTSIARNATSLALTGLIPSQTYLARIAAVNVNGTSTYSTSTFTTLPATPTTLTVAADSRTSIAITLNADTNGTSTEYALYNETLGSYVDASGIASGSAVFQIMGAWSGIAASGLTCGTTYGFSAYARNANEDISAASAAASVATTACAVAATGGGGGGGGMAPPVSSYQTVTYVDGKPVTTTQSTAPVPTTPAPVPSEPATTPELPSSGTAPSTPAPSQPAPQRIITGVAGDAREFSVTLSSAQVAILADFITNGSSQASLRLGEGERRAVIRDFLDTMRRGPNDVSDLDRISSGEIPHMRNLTQERLQLDRVRATFVRIFGHLPNFKDPQENLAWNTMMYRIRFPRDLPLESEGIQTFRQFFARTPQDPFQWAVVRVLGYVK